MCVLCHHRDEADEFVEIGALNGIFVLGRSMGFIGELYSVYKRRCFCFLCDNQCFFIFASPQDTTWTRRDLSRACIATPGTTSPTCSQSTCLCNSASFLSLLLPAHTVHCHLKAVYKMKGRCSN